LILCSSFFSDWDLVFADDERESNPTSFKFMQMAHAWKQAQKGASGTSGTGASKLLSGFTPATAKEEKSDDDDSDGAGEVADERVQRPGGGGNDEDVSSSEDEDEDED
jgi:crooked neck